MRNAALRHYQASPKCWRYFYCGRERVLWGARRSPQHPSGVRTPPQRSCRSLGDQVRARCSLCALSFSTCTPSTACGRVGACFAQNWRCARRSFITLRSTHARRRTPPRTDGHQRALVTTCRIGGVPFVPKMTHTESCCVAPRSRQYLARGIGFCWQQGLRHRLVWQETCSAFFSLAPLCPRKHTGARLFRRERGCLQRLRRSVAAQHRGIPARVLANAVAQSAVWVLVLRTLTHSVSDAVLAPSSRRNSGASVSAAARVFAAYETLNSSLALWHHAQMLARAVALRAARAGHCWR